MIGYFLLFMAVGTLAGGAATFQEISDNGGREPSREAWIGISIVAAISAICVCVGVYAIKRIFA